MVSKSTGFTLVEVLVASTIGSFIALVAVGSLRVIIGGSEAVDDNINSAAEVRFAANMIARDLANFYRDENYQNTRFIATIEELDDDSTTSYIVFYALSRKKARIGQPEGDIYEVEYYLVKDEETSALMRRQWPNPHKELEPGGILTAIAENIEVFDIKYFDGEEWTDEWPEEMQSLPHLAEVTLVAKPSGQGVPAAESLIVNFVRAQGYEGGGLPQAQGGPANSPTNNSGTSPQGSR
ncbi:MAG: prepilin-type N-terminal cleavage/methylation domain-containing protein [Phycisphaerales bacterium]|nr:MAG: prepilin-type N-terminal cleavage/methylation domain-containing protein [Phycisphaerales bacterium]